MASFQDGPRFAAPAASDLSTTGQYLGVVLGSGGTIAVNTSAGGKISGVLIDDPKSGVNGTVQYRDVCEVKVSAAVAVGAELMCAADGTFLTATSTNARVALALQAGSGSGSIITALIGFRGVA